MGSLVEPKFATPILLAVAATVVIGLAAVRAQGAATGPAPAGRPAALSVHSTSRDRDFEIRRLRLDRP